ncbi:nucleotide exchange factor GrpE [Pedococcus sp. KACC 23699]|uniref:Protein GrpE n=1 Tax=Pedococcus sp. KACC 23699 TaxID=3149228 RepID=A0AAU7JY72_9MICO
MTERSSQPEGTEEVVGAGQQTAPAAPEAAPLEGDVVDEATPEQETAPASDEHPDSVLAAERLVDLQRLQAEYVNYKRRVDRDRAVVQERAAQSVVEALLPVLDDIHAAREHGDLEGGPFASIADKLESTLGKFGLERYGAVGEQFDPNLHEALMHTAWPQDGSVTSTGSTTVVQVLQPGYRAGEQVLRAARVAVADPE